MLQFPDVSRPRIVKQLLAGLVVEFEWGLVIEIRISLDKLFCQWDDFLLALAQWRQVQTDGIDAIEKVFAECSFSNHLLQVAVGGGDKADVDGNLLGVSKACDCPALKGSEQFGLKRVREIADFIKKQRTALCQLHLPRFVALGIGKCATHISEEFALKQRLGDCTHIHSNHLLSRAS